MELVSNFTTSTNTGVAPLIVTFTNNSSGPYIKTQWDFGDGTLSAEINPVHQYLNDGVYQVTLTIYDQFEVSTSSVGTITVFTEGNIDSTGTSVQYGLFTNKRFLPGEVNVVKQTQTGSNFETEFPMKSATELADIGAFELIGNGTSFTGEHDVEFTYSTVTGDGAAMETYLTDNTITQDYGYVMVGVGDATSAAENSWAYFIGQIRPALFYKILDINTGTNTITVDRSLLNSTGGGASAYVPVFAFITKTGSTSANTFSTNEVTSNVKKQQAIDSYDEFETTGMGNKSEVGKGSLSYFGYNGGTGTTISVISPNYSGNHSADAISPGSFFYRIPWIMWHNHQTTDPGISLYDSYDNTQRDEATGLRYRYLRDGVYSYSNIVGKIFYDKKNIVIDDPELNVVLQFNSNRSYTLPAPIVGVSDTSGGFTETGITYYITYRVLDDADVDRENNTMGLSANTGLHCRYIQKFTTDEEDLQLNLSIIESPWVVTTSSTPEGVTMYGIEAIVGTGTTTTPDKTSFRLMPRQFFNVATTNGITIDTYDGAGTSAYSFVDTPLSGNSDLSFATEPLGVGYMSGTWESNIYKMAATCVAKNTEFNQTQNETFSNSSTESVYITEVALYNENNDLLMIGKLSTPIEKNNQKYIAIKMEIDL